METLSLPVLISKEIITTDIIIFQHYFSIFIKPYAEKADFKWNETDW